MLLEIKKFNDRVLRKKCQDVQKITDEIKQLVFNMKETMKKNNGIGLAASQVGVLKRIIVVQTDPKDLTKIIALINPKIIKKSREREVGEEGCLSFPGIFLEIKRVKKIEVEFLDINAKKIRLKARGLLARALHHEIDHLDGILFFDRLGFLKRIKFILKHPKISI